MKPLVIGFVASVAVIAACAGVHRITGWDMSFLAGWFAGITFAAFNPFKASRS